MLAAAHASGPGLVHVLWIIVLVAFGAIPIALTGWAFLDAAYRPQWAWALSRHRQVVWMTAILFGVMCGGIFISGWYLARVRPAVRAIEDGKIDLP